MTDIIAMHSAEPVIFGVVKIVWKDGFAGIVDLRPLLAKGEMFEFLRVNPARFDDLKLEEHGHKIFWLDQVLREGRNRGAAPDGTNVAPATLAGVRMVLKHLKRGGCSVVLPDQVPGLGEGEWAEFFGRPAYTMTLLGRLQEASNAALVFCFAERLPKGAGYRLHLEAAEAPLPADRNEAARQVNARVERLVRACPSQYLWGYNRYKRPAGAPPPPASPLRANT